MPSSVWGLWRAVAVAAAVPWLATGVPVSVHSAGGARDAVLRTDTEAARVALMRKERRATRSEEAAILQRTVRVEDRRPRNYTGPFKPLPLARQCFEGGFSGGRDGSLLQFKNVVQPVPPMSVVTRIRTSSTGVAQTILGWESDSGDLQMSALRVTEDGNLEFVIHDGYRRGNVTANPPVNITDGRWHSVAVVREGHKKSIGVAALYVDSILVGEGYLDAYATHLRPVASTARLLEGGRTNLFQGDIGHLRIFDKALSVAEIWRASRQPCVATIRLGAFHNNLGGLGPDEGEQALRYYNVSTWADVPVDLLITNLTTYLPQRRSRNGASKGGLGRISVAAGAPTRLAFRFVKTNTTKAVRMDGFFFSFFHVEQGNRTTKEAVTIESPFDTYWVFNQTSEVQVSGSVADSSLTFTSLDHGPKNPFTLEGITRPWAPMNQTQTQVKCAFAVKFSRKSGFVVTVNVVGSPSQGREVIFAGNSSVVSDGVLHVPL